MVKESQTATSSGVNPLTEVFEKFRAIIVTPREFFDNMSLDSTLMDSAIFVLVVSALSAAGILIATMKPLQAVQEFFVRIVISFISSAYLMVLSRGFGGNGGFPQTFRAFAYAAAPGVISWIPLLNLIAGIYSLYLMRLGLERAQGLTTQKAVTVIAIWIITLIGLFTLIFFMVAATIFRAKADGLP